MKDVAQHIDECLGDFFRVSDGERPIKIILGTSVIWELRKSLGICSEFYFLHKHEFHGIPVEMDEDDLCGITFESIGRRISFVWEV